MQRYQSLDGWRGLSILMVLLGHLFPLGPSYLQLNSSVAATGMAIFFILSGFLITTMLIKNSSVKQFIIRRFLRIVPLAWLGTVVALIIHSGSLEMYLAHLFFYANWEPMQLTEGTGHFWSLAVEMQFYVLIALMVVLFKKKVFWLLPIMCIAVTAYRAEHNVLMTINTYFRLDEILAGCMLALISAHGSTELKEWFCKISPIFLFVLLIFSAHPESGLLNYFRPYIAMLLIASTLYSNNKNWIDDLLKNRYLVYLATISYALYVIHGILTYTWLGEGERLEKYLKRPLLLGVTFALAHFSTFYYEKYWIDIGRRITKKQ